MINKIYLSEFKYHVDRLIIEKYMQQNYLINKGFTLRLVIIDLILQLQNKEVW